MPNATIIRTECIVFLETTKEIWKSDEKMARCGILIKKLGSVNVGLQDFFCSNKHRCWPRYWKHSIIRLRRVSLFLYTAYYCCQNPSTSPKVVKWCYKHEPIIKKAPCPCSFLKSQYLFLFPYYRPVEQMLVFRVFRASGVRHARVWCSSLAHVFPPSLSCMHACNHFAAC